MLIYLLIAAELAILYTVFWYVFVHEPKPYKFKKGLWGKYSDVPNSLNNVESVVVPIGYESGGQLSKIEYVSSGNLHFKQTHYIARRATRPRVYPISESMHESSIIERLSRIYFHIIDSINVKTP